MHSLVFSAPAGAQLVFSFQGTPSGGFEGKKDQVKLLSGIVQVGLGEKSAFTLSRFLTAVSQGIWAARRDGMRDLAVIVPKLPHLSSEDALARTVEAAIVTARVFDTYRQKTKENVKRIDALSFVILPKEHPRSIKPRLKKTFERALIIAEMTNLARDLQDTPPSDLFPASFASRTQELAKRYGLAFTLLDEKELAKRGFNAIIAVGNGSAHRPCLAIIEYKGRGKNICLIGKGITFDSGGYDLKKKEGMEELKHDMSGAATVLATVVALARLKAKAHVIGILPLAENMVSGTAYRPSDIITTLDKTTVEVSNTDAEGRLVLADALTHAATLKPHAIIDLATLTGACRIALGTVRAGVISNDDRLVKEILGAGERTGERLWRLPDDEEYAADLESKIADCKSTGYQQEAGTITGGLFLKQFVGECSWVHIDTAGVAFTHRPRHLTEDGGTGWGVRLLCEWLG